MSLPVDSSPSCIVCLDPVRPNLSNTQKKNVVKRLKTTDQLVTDIEDILAQRPPGTVVRCPDLTKKMQYQLHKALSSSSKIFRRVSNPSASSSSEEKGNDMVYFMRWRTEKDKSKKTRGMKKKERRDGLNGRVLYVHHEGKFCDACIEDDEGMCGSKWEDVLSRFSF